MRIIVLVMAVVFLSSSGFAADCSLVKIAALPLEDDGHGRPVVQVEINGTPRRFLVDTAGFISGISPTVARELGLSPQEITSMEIYGGGGEVKKFVRVQTLKFGPATARSAQLLLEQNLPAGVDGILSPEYLRNFDLDFDFAAKTLNLFSQDHCKGQVVYWTSDYSEIPFHLSFADHVSLPMTLDGREVAASLDTGASHTVISSQKAAALFDLTEKVAVPDEGADDYKTYRFQSLAIEGLSINNPLVIVHLDQAERAFQRKHGTEKTQHIIQYRIDLETPDIIVGMNVLRRLHLYIAYKEKILYLSPAEARL